VVFDNHKARGRPGQRQPSRRLIGPTPRPPSGLNAAGRAAWREAVAVVGDDAGFGGAVGRYARAVDVAGRVRAEWVRGGRLIVACNPNGASGVHPVLKAVFESERMAADLGARLGLDPASAKRIWPHRGRGRPLGAVSAPDRKALPPLQFARPRMRTTAPPPRAIAAAVNRARGLGDADD
jgi:phage terminase small subunit